jgi:hypothetical protein
VAAIRNWQNFFPLQIIIMAKFIAGNELNLEIEKLLENAEKSIILVSPFIKLHRRYESVLKSKIERHSLRITILFGKNSEQMQKSMSYEDFAFFKQFPNIEIRYEKNLHAKYYANEKSAILTSMNLYSYSHDHNIEAGILTETTLAATATKLIAGNLVENIDENAWKYFSRVINQSELLYKKEPVYEDKLLGLTKKFKTWEVKHDVLSAFFERLPKANDPEYSRHSREPHLGYCIRTGISIPFNINMPLSDASFESWKRYENRNYEENYCHFSGEPSYGETCFAKPILYKYWKVAGVQEQRARYH